jgi:hypothetical protein
MTSARSRWLRAIATSDRSHSASAMSGYTPISSRRRRRPQGHIAAVEVTAKDARDPLQERRCRRCDVLRSTPPYGLVGVGAHLFGPGTRYTDLGNGYYQARTDLDRKLPNHIRQIQALGSAVTLTKAS